MRIKKICCIGAGYVGGPTMAVIAYKCPDIKVTVVDNNEHRINQWNGDIDDLPIYEPGLSEIVNKTRGKNLFFSNEIDKAIDESEMIFMAVNTPTKNYGEGKGMAADLTFVENCARKIAEVSKSDKIIIEKSTLPVRTAEKIKEVLESNNIHNVNFEVLSNPEFLAEGTAIDDLFKSDRDLIGGENSKTGNEAINKLVQIYKKWIPEDKIITTSVWSSELSKLVSNAMLAQRISSINAVSAICEKTGADIDEVSIAVGMDTRIGKSFLKSSIGFGGSCFKKDILNLVYISKNYGLQDVAEYWESVVNINTYQTDRFGKQIIESLNSTVSNKTLSVFGWAFKKDTNDSRESAAISLTVKLLEEDANINVYDPMVKDKTILSDLKYYFENQGKSVQYIEKMLSKVKIYNDVYEASKEASLITICTEWDEFRTLDWKIIFESMKKPSWIFDGRNLLNRKELEDIGFKTFFIGKSS